MIPKGTGHEFWKSVEAGAERRPMKMGSRSSSRVQPARETLRARFKSSRVSWPTITMRSASPLSTRRRCANRLTQLGQQRAGGDFRFRTRRHEGRDELCCHKQPCRPARGEYLVELLGGKGRVILIRHNIGSKSTEDREQGFLDALAKAKDIELLSSDKHGGPGEADSVNWRRVPRQFRRKDRRHLLPQ